MPRIVFAAALVLLACAGNSATATPSARINCEHPHEQARDLAPLNDGPLTIATIYCQAPRDFANVGGEQIVSPDGRAVLYFDRDELLHVSRVDQRDGWISHELGLSGLSRGEPFAWRSDSRAVWTVRDHRMRPRGGWRLEPLQPLLIEGESIRELPQLVHAAGGLDNISWIGGDGLALAEFGTMGDYYRPEVANPRPTLAIVNARTGRVLDSLAIADIPRPAGSDPAPAYMRIRDYDAVVLPNGRVRILMRARHWVIWTQGQGQRTLPDPDPHGVGRVLLTADGQRALWLPALRAYGVICEHNPNCPAPTPTEGLVAQLYDLNSGDLLWSISGRATQMGSSRAAAISPDGRLALISLPTGDDYKVPVAVISMHDGEILQRLPTPDYNPFNVGFTRDGRAAWLAGYGVTALYDVR
jgi:hypothetical protein